ALQTGLVGAEAGALSGAGEAPPGKVPERTLAGGGTGFVLGTGLGGTAGAISNAIARYGRTPAEIGQDMLIKAFSDEGMPLTDAAAKAAAAPIGEPLSTADMGGRSVSKLVAAVARTPGPGGTVVAKKFGERAETEAGRALFGVERAAGVRGDA